MTIIQKLASFILKKPKVNTNKKISKKINKANKLIRKARLVKCELIQFKQQQNFNQYTKRLKISEQFDHVRALCGYDSNTKTHCEQEILKRELKIRDTLCSCNIQLAKYTINMLKLTLIQKEQTVIVTKKRANKLLTKAHKISNKMDEFSQKIDNQRIKKIFDNERKVFKIDLEIISSSINLINKIKLVREEFEKVANTMHDNIEKIIARGENLEELQKIAVFVEKEGKEFLNSTKKVVKKKTKHFSCVVH